MAKIWKKIEEYKPLKSKIILKRLKRKKIILSAWIENIFLNYKIKIKKEDFPFYLYRVSVKKLGISRPASLKQIYKKIKKNGYRLVPPELALIARIFYKEQKTGEWLRFATPLKSMVDRDGVPHLPKLGKALNKYFIETYWSYPKAVFHPHNEFVVLKKNVKKNKNQ